MKTKLVSAEPKQFKPVTIEITFETQEELDDFASLCNHCAFCETIKLPSHSFMESIGGNLKRPSIIEEKIMRHPCMFNWKKI